MINYSLISKEDTFKKVRVESVKLVPLDHDWINRVVAMNMGKIVELKPSA
jgi:hypothetical protein